MVLDTAGKNVLEGPRQARQALQQVAKDLYEGCEDSLSAVHSC